MKQIPAKVAAELRPPQRGSSLGWAMREVQLASVPAEGLAQLCKRHPIPLPMNSATCFTLCSGSLTVRVSQAWVKIWPFFEQLLAAALEPWAPSPHHPQPNKQAALWTLSWREVLLRLAEKPLKSSWFHLKPKITYPCHKGYDKPSMINLKQNKPHYM